MNCSKNSIDSRHKNTCDIATSPPFLLRVLLSELNQIGRPDNYPRAFQAIERMFSILTSSSRFIQSNEKLCHGLVSANALEIITYAIQDPSLEVAQEQQQEQQEQQEQQQQQQQQQQQRHLKFIDRGLRCIIRIIFKSKERSTYFVNKVGLDGILKLMKHHQTNAELQSLFLALLVCIPRSVDPILATVSTKRVTPLIFYHCVEVMCIHQESPVIFQTACCVIQGWRACFRCPIMDGELFSRIVNSVWKGLWVYTEDGKCQKVGRQALRLLVGGAKAKAMIDHKEGRNRTNSAGPMCLEEQRERHQVPQQQQQQQEGRYLFGQKRSMTKTKSSQCAPAA